MSPILKLMLLGYLAVAIAARSTSFTKISKDAWAIGSRIPGDKIIQHFNVYIPSSFSRVIKAFRVLRGDRTSKITQIVLTYQSFHGSGAEASLISGGPGQNYATIQFKSKKDHGINFLVEVYGIRPSS